jgi:hypothetical protein
MIKMPACTAKSKGEKYQLACFCLEVPTTYKLASLANNILKTLLQNVNNYKDKDLSSAKLILQLWLRFRQVVLQNEAQMIVNDKNRRGHPLFQLPVFCCAEFDVRNFCLFVCLFVCLFACLLFIYTHFTNLFNLFLLPFLGLRKWNACAS